MTTLPEPRRIALPGRWNDPHFHLSVYEAGAGPPVVLCHGFPDLAVGWRHQITALAEAGFRVIAPDMRGYGGSSAPSEVEAYGMAEISGDLVALLDALEIERAVFVGHDWGGFITWAMPLLHPQRVAGVAGLCTPYMPFPGLDIHLALVEGEVERQYVAWFQQPGVAEAYMNPRTRPILSNIMRTHVPLEEVLALAMADGKLNMNPFLDVENKASLGDPLMDAEDFEYYVETFTRTGFGGGINWYRNIDANLRNHPQVGVQPLDLPCLMLTAADDPALRPELAADMPERCSSLEMHNIENAGHWLQQERADEVNRHLTAWLRRLS